MAASLCIQVFSSAHPQNEVLNFFEAEEWNADAEKQLLLKMRELMSLVKTPGKKFQVIVNVEVADINESIFLIKKKMTARSVINDPKLSIREIEILGLVMQGFTNNEIADKLFISYETVKSHRKNILDKTGAKNTAALINYYHETFFEK
ncbi:response regulator transcription factor [Flavitalea sp.]|nr:helix-turn-helix transcriptional regulator [Flavitalea sp.]